MRFNVRKLNSGEKYACNIKDVKSIFGNENVYVGFGYFNRHFRFDSSGLYKKPYIEGTIIASASVSNRDGFVGNNGSDGIYFINFYVINDFKYDTEKKKMFVELYLPLLYKWYQEMQIRPETSLSGVENFLVEWCRNDFKTHCYRYH